MNNPQKAKTLKIFLAATAGGHLTEILALFENLPACQVIIFSNKTTRMKMFTYEKYGYFHISNHSILTMITAFLKSFYLILKTRPDWVISTGAECGTSAILAAKVLFRKTIFVETASRHRTRTMAARICYPLVTHFYVQTKEGLAVWGKKAEYIGGLI